MKCKVCNREYEAKRATSKYCSDKCRLSAYRGVSVSIDAVGGDKCNAKTETVKFTIGKKKEKVAVLHPQPGTNQVVINKKNRAWFSYWDESVPLRPEDCKCEVCMGKSI